MRAVGLVGIPPPGNDGPISTSQKGLIRRRRQARLENSPLELEVDLPKGVLQENGPGQVSICLGLFFSKPSGTVNWSASPATWSAFASYIGPSFVPLAGNVGIRWRGQRRPGAGACSQQCPCGLVEPTWIEPKRGVDPKVPRLGANPLFGPVPSQWTPADFQIGT